MRGTFGLTALAFEMQIFVCVCVCLGGKCHVNKLLIILTVEGGWLIQVLSLQAGETAEVVRGGEMEHGTEGVGGGEALTPACSRQYSQHRAQCLSCHERFKHWRGE